MKPEEASQVIRDSYIPKMFNALEGALEVAIQALEKQVPKKPIEISHPQYDVKIGICFCGQGNNIYKKYCHNCGQKINWEETP